MTTTMLPRLAPKGRCLTPAMPQAHRASRFVVTCRSQTHDTDHGLIQRSQASPVSATRNILPCVAASAAALVLAQPAFADIAVDAASAPAVEPLTEGFVQGFLLIFFSELGDKTFFIALLLSLQRDKTSVFIGTFGALGIMTVISVGLGRALHQLDELVPVGLNSVPWDDVLAVVLLTYFGIATIVEAKNAEEKAAGEKKDAEEEVDALNTDTTGIILSTFLLVFAAEWGDKSFLATIALAATSSPAGVTVGAVTGHGLATALAVAGGGLLSKNVSEIVVQYSGGVLFLVFAAVSSYQIIEKMALL